MSLLRISRIGENVSVAMAMITPEEMNDTHMASTHFKYTLKTLYIRFLHMQSTSEWQLGKFIAVVIATRFYC